MNNGPLFFFRLVAAIAFCVSILAGVYLFRNIEKLVPADSGVGGETSSDRMYAKFLIFAVWAHAVVLSGSFALLIH